MLPRPEPQLRKDAIQARARNQRKRLHTRGKRAEDLIENLVRVRSLRHAGEYFIDHFRRQHIVIGHRWPPPASGSSPRYARQPLRSACSLARRRPRDRANRGNEPPSAPSQADLNSRAGPATHEPIRSSHTAGHTEHSVSAHQAPGQVAGQGRLADTGRIFIHSRPSAEHTVMPRVVWLGLVIVGRGS